MKVELVFVVDGKVVVAEADLEEGAKPLLSISMLGRPLPRRGQAAVKGGGTEVSGMVGAKMGEVVILQEDEPIERRVFAYRDRDEFERKAVEFVGAFFECAEEGGCEIIQQLREAIDAAWNGREWVAPTDDEYTVVFRSIAVEISEIEAAAWNAAKELWKELEEVKVPEGKREEVMDAVEDCGYIATSDGSEYVVRIYLTVDNDGRIRMVTENGDRVDLQDIYEHELIYDVFGLIRWLTDAKDTISRVLEKRGE